MKPNNLLYRKCVGGSFFKDWILFLTPYHRLSVRQRKVAARLLEQYFKLKESVQDIDVLYEVLWSKKSRQDIRTSLGMGQENFQMSLSKLKKSGFLVNGRIEPRYIPHITDQPRFFLQVVFDWSSEENPIKKKDE